MQVLFRERAEDDLRNIIAWFGETAPDAVPRILEEIYRSIDFLIDFPRTGMRVPGTPFRRIVTRRYHFKMAYELIGEAVAIAGIYRHQDRVT